MENTKVMPEVIKLDLKAIDFKNTRFIDVYNCAISKAVKRQLNAKRVSSGTVGTRISGDRYSHQSYGHKDFNEDLIVAEKYNFSENVLIRCLTLYKNV